MQRYTNAEMTEMVLMYDVSTVKLSPVGIYQITELSMPLFSVSENMEDFVPFRRTGVPKKATKH